MNNKSYIDKLHPDARKMVLSLPECNFDHAESKFPRRSVFHDDTLIPKREASLNTYDKIVPGLKDNPEVRVRIYELNDKTKNAPVFYWIHGGGYMVGLPEHEDELCQRIALETGCVLVFPAYRLAPEDPYPAALDDCYTGLLWAVENAKKLGVAINTLSIGGQSAGGGLALAAALRARDFNGPGF